MYFNNNSHSRQRLAQSTSPSPLGVNVATVSTTRSGSIDSEDDSLVILSATTNTATPNAITPQALEGALPDHDESNDMAEATPNIATSNFDANYLATMGKDTESIEIRVDNRKRATSLLQRLEGRSESGGILGNLIRLHSLATSDKRAEASRTLEDAQLRKPAPAHLPRNQSWTTLPSMLRTFRTTGPSGPSAIPADTTVDNERRFSSGATTPAQGRSYQNLRASVLSGHPISTPSTTHLPRSISSARISALMMTPEALAKNGIIPPPSTQSSLRLDEKFSAGYFALDKSPGHTPLLDDNSPDGQQEDDGGRAELVNKIADILERQDFLMHLARAWHAFGSPVHRMETNLMEVARYLSIDACFFTVPGLTLISFGDPDTHSSETHIVRASEGYDMHRLEQVNQISRQVRKGRATVHESIRKIEALLAAPPQYSWYLRVLVCFAQSFCVSATLFQGSWYEALLAGGLGLMIGAAELLGAEHPTLGYLVNVIPPMVVSLVTTLISDHVCFAAVPMAATINLLPGLSLAMSMLELSSSNIICGAVRLISATTTSFVLGWSISIGRSLGMAARGWTESAEGFASYSSCSGLSMWWWFLWVPISSVGFSIWFKAHWKRWPATIVAAAIGLVIQTYCDRIHVLRPISAGIGSFAVGVFSSVYGRVLCSASSADIVFVGIIQLVPGSTGVRSFVSLLSDELSASSLTMSMLSTSISIAVGLLLSNGAFYSEHRRFKLGSF
ncbi:pheromone-regulated protein prm10 [Coemansia sp. RSA 2675]|nr:pheromone-regulated protein prm10 [Coemansia sp. RSA 2675]